MVLFILIFWSLSQYIPNGEPITVGDWQIELNNYQNNNFESNIPWQRILAASNKACNHVFYGKGMELNGTPIGERLIKILNSPTGFPLLDDKLKTWNVSREDLKRFVENVCQQDPLKGSPATATSPALPPIANDRELMFETLKTVKSILATLPDVQIKPTIPDIQSVAIAEPDWGTGNPLPFTYNLKIENKTPVLPNSCVKNQNWVSKKDLPPLLIKAFLAAEDKDFEKHPGVSFNGMLRAAMTRGGASTITLQTLKNLYFECQESSDNPEAADLNKKITSRWQRKIKEFILARAFEKNWSKDGIIEAYINIIYFGHNTYGIAAASQRYFNKKPQDLDLEEMAFLASLPKNPSGLTKDTEFPKLVERSQYVLNQMIENKWIDEETKKKSENQHFFLGRYSGFTSPSESAYLSSILYELRKSKITLKPKSKIVPQINSPLQTLAQETLIEHLSQFDVAAGKTEILPETNLQNLFEIQAQPSSGTPPPATAPTKPSNPTETWLQILANYKLTPPVKSWKKAVVTAVQNGRIRKAIVEGVGEVALESNLWPSNKLKQWIPGDIIWAKAKPIAGNQKTKTAQQWQWKLAFRPLVEGALVAMDINTGAVYAISSSDVNQNNAIQAWRQPGSTIKPFTYLYALENGFSAVDLIPDRPIVLPPVSTPGQSWSPKNYDGVSHLEFPLRYGLEKSKNLMTVNLLKKINPNSPAQSLDGVIRLTQDLGIYAGPPTLPLGTDHNAAAPSAPCVEGWDCGIGQLAPERYYPFILGARETNLLRLVTAYAQLANGGFKVKPSFIKQILDETGHVLYENKLSNEKLNIKSTSLAQLKNIMTGVLKRGTATSAAHLYPYVAGKTGTSNDQHDAWFIGYSSSIVVGVWIGYDRQQNLGKGQTGGSLAVPIVDAIFSKLFAIDDSLDKTGAVDPQVSSYIPSFRHSPLMSQDSGLLVKLNFDRLSGCFLGDILNAPPESGEIEELIEPGRAEAIVKQGPQIDCLRQRYFSAPTDTVVDEDQFPAYSEQDAPPVELNPYTDQTLAPPPPSPRPQDYYNQDDEEPANHRKPNDEDANDFDDSLF